MVKPGRQETAVAGEIRVVQHTRRTQCITRYSEREALPLEDIWFEEVANEIAASVAIVDQVNDEGSIGEVVEHF